MTHRLFSRNAASSRAIPVNKIIDAVRAMPAMPIHWGKNKPGMKAEEELDSLITMPEWAVNAIATREMCWDECAQRSADIAESMHSSGYHKQIVNRLLEPFQMIKVVCTATEYDNFFHLRNHMDAQPEIHELARVMYSAMSKSEPELLNPGEWHTPYVLHSRGEDTGRMYYHADGHVISRDEALKVSASCCAQVSYRLTDNSVEKSIDIYNKLVDSKPVHASPFEHQATPMEFPNELIDIGATHIDVYSSAWSGNMKGWIQHRQLIPENVCMDYDPCEYRGADVHE
jgi:hypothetical protein